MKLNLSTLIFQFYINILSVIRIKEFKIFLQELGNSINSPSLPRATILPQKLPITSQNYNNQTDTLRYGTGRSTFYMEASPKYYETAKNFSKTVGKTLKPADETLYLSNSTFYNDKNSKIGFYPKDWKSSPAGMNRNGSSSQINSNLECQDRTKPTRQV